MSTQDPITQRFIEVFEWLKTNNRVRSARQFALSIDTYAQSLNDILKGRREATLQNIQRTTEVYNINSHYLLTGQGSYERSDINGVSTSPKVNVTYLQAHEFCGYVSAKVHSNIEDHQWNTWALPEELIGQNIGLAIQCNTDRISSSINKGDVLFLRCIPQEAWKSSISSKRIYVVTLKDCMHIVRVIKNDTNGLYLHADDRDLPAFINYQDILEVWSTISKWSYNVMVKEENDVSMAKLETLERSIQSQNKSIVVLTETVQSLMTQQELQKQY